MLRPLLTLTALAILLQSSCVAVRTGQDGEPSGASRNKSAKQSLLAGFQLFNGAVERAPETVLADLEEARSSASGDELKAIDTLLPILGDQVHHQPVSPAAERLLGKLLQQYGKEHPEDFEVQLTVAKGLDRVETDLQTGSGSGSSGDGDTSTPAATVTRALTLSGTFPNQSLAHEYLAKVLASAGGDQLSGMRSYVRCLQLDPNSVPCRNGLKLMAAEYTQPICVEYAKSKFSVQRAYSQAKRLGARATSVTLMGQKLYLDPRLALTGGDIQEISKAATKGDDSWLVTLTPEGAQRYFTLTTELASKQDFALIRINGKAVSAPRVLSPVDGGQLSITLGGFDPAKLCQQNRRRSLPPDLADVIR